MPVSGPVESRQGRLSSIIEFAILIRDFLDFGFVLGTTVQRKRLSVKSEERRPPFDFGQQLERKVLEPADQKGCGYGFQCAEFERNRIICRV